MLDEVDALAAQVIARACACGARIAVAESLTGGLLAATLVRVPGASQVFAGGVVAYETAVKRTVLGVDAQLLRRGGPVQEAVAQQMATGLGAALGVPVTHVAATTGVAGPAADPQTGAAPGLFFVAAGRLPGDVVVQRQVVPGQREQVRLAAVAAALRLLLESF